MEPKKLFNERYPNRKIERRNQQILQMIPAPGWWQVHVQRCDNYTWIEAVAFFAKVTYEARSVWDGGSSKWESDSFIFANCGNNEEWSFDYYNSDLCSNKDCRLFYNPDFRLSRDEQFAGQEWIDDTTARNIERKLEKEARDAEKHTIPGAKP